MRRAATVAALGFVAALGLGCLTLAGENSLGRKIDGFQLDDYRGKEHSLAEYRDKQAVVLAFVGTECPLAKLYGPRLAELAKEFESRGAAFLAIDSNRQDSITEIAAYARTHGIEFPVLKDMNNKVADLVGATRTPEVFVLDKSGTVRYQGRIDDQYGLTIGSNYAKPKLEHRDLAMALDELLSGKEVAAPYREATGCLIGRMREPDAKSAVTYSNQIARILQNRCVECHRQGQIAPFALTSYDEVVGWADMMAEVVRDGRMPPWHASPKYGKFKNDRHMSDEEKALIDQWLAAGAPEGDPSDLPAPREYSEEWMMPEPDLVVYMDDEPYTVPAEGVVEYQYFTVDPGFTEDKWVSASECKPGSRSVVHHIFVFVQPPGADGEEAMGGEELEKQREERHRARQRGEGGIGLGSGSTKLICGTAPGVPPFVNPEGMCFFIPKGSKLIFQMHYTPNGSETLDRSCVGLKFADPKDVRAEIEMDMAINFAFQIPAGADNHPVESTHKFDRATEILSLTPHMHLRGKSFRYDLVYADGTRKTLMEVPRYDFNWQITYQLAEPVLAPAGSRLECLAHFDNSEENLANPDPTKPVRWGDQTWEEMMIGWFAKSADLDFDSMAPDKTRTAGFLKEAAGGKLKVSKRIGKVAARALDSDKTFGILYRLLGGLVPQVDRMDVSVTDGDTLRFLAVNQPPLVGSKVGGQEAEITGEKLALAEYARAKAPVVHNELSASLPQADLSTMARALRSSAHVPVTIDGRAAVVSFWSRERNAFPPEAMELLVQVAEQIGRQPSTEKTAALNGK
ncbi:MAG: redoxin domain-containing protein [Pirellulales bacterium]|nr:redoxin domain-containing protein [Pirellulales bacterium]